MSTLGKFLSEVYRVAESSVSEDLREHYAGSLCVEKVDVRPCRDLAFVDTGINRIRLRNSDYVIFVVCKIERGKKPEIIVRIERAEHVYDPYVFARVLELRLAKKSCSSVIVLDGVFENYEDQCFRRVLKDVVINCGKVLVFVTKNARYMAGKDCEIILLDSKHFGELNYRKYAVHTIGNVYLIVETVFYSSTECVIGALKALQELSRTSACPGYPLPMYIADYLCRANLKLCYSIRTLLSRALNVFDINLVRSVWSLSDDISRSVREHVQILHGLS